MPNEDQLCVETQPQRVRATIAPDAMAARLAQLPRALVDVRRTSSAQSREEITKCRKTLLPICKLLYRERSAFGQYSAITALSGPVPQNVEALLEGRAFESKYRGMERTRYRGRRSSGEDRASHLIDRG